MNIIDLHVHSTKSDGTYSPTQLVDYALEKGLCAFALTDHDTTDGLKEAILYAQDKPIEIIPGVELSCEYHKRDIHMLGLFIDYENEDFKKHLDNFKNSRFHRNEKMCEKLREYGASITYEDLLAIYPDATITRSHYAAYLCEQGFIKTTKEAFDRYIGDHGPCFIPREKITPTDAIKLILQAGGIPVLAHPILYGLGTSTLDALVKELKEDGLLGIETVYSTYSPADERSIRKLAKKYNLLITGGSDFHGANKPTIDLATGLGKLFIPEELLTKLKSTRRKILFSDMDGTLLRSDSTISPTLLSAIHQYMENDNRLVLTSGRPLASILNVAKAHDLLRTNAYCIAFNGALVYDVTAKKPIFEVTLSPEEISYIVTQAKKWGLHFHGYNDTHIVSEKDTKELTHYTKKIQLPVQYTDDLCKTLDKSYKLLCIDLDDTQNLINFRDSLQDFAKGRLQLIFSNPNFLEIFSIHAGKGIAIENLCEQLQVSPVHAYAAGDAENDISMFTTVGNGIAVANATDGIKSLATFITKEDCDHDGLMGFFNNSLI